MVPLKPSGTKTYGETIAQLAPQRAHAVGSDPINADSRRNAV